MPRDPEGRDARPIGGAGPPGRGAPRRHRSGDRARGRREADVPYPWNLRQSSIDFIRNTWFLRRVSPIVADGSREYRWPG
ncbi:MAG: hypothetical protein HMLKMBBP_00034 [Planctomycetes bacterium]|nr:hypothetical protein [Planctomycetota bacterium]